MKGGRVGEEMGEEDKVQLAWGGGGSQQPCERARRDYDTTIQLGRQERLLLWAFLTGIGIGQVKWKLAVGSKPCTESTFDPGKQERSSSQKKIGITRLDTQAPKPSFSRLDQGCHAGRDGRVCQLRGELGPVA